MPEHPSLTRPMSIRGQHAERRRQVLKLVVDNPGRLGASSLATKTGLDFRDVEDAVDGLRLKGMLRNNGKALLSPTRDGVFLITGKEEIGRIDQLHMLLLSRGPMSTGVLAKRMSLSRSRVVALLRLLADEGRARQEGDARNVRWAGIPIKSRCDPEGTARTGRQQTPAEPIQGKAPKTSTPRASSDAHPPHASPPEPAPVQPSNIDASNKIDEPKDMEAPGKGESPDAAEGTIPDAEEPGRSADTLTRLPRGTGSKALTALLNRAKPGKWYRKSEIVALVAEFGIRDDAWAYHFGIAIRNGALQRKGKTNLTRYRVRARDIDTDIDTDPVTEETDEAPPNVVPMPRPEPEDHEAEMQRRTVETQIELMVKARVHLIIDLAKVEGCLVALRGLL